MPSVTAYNPRAWSVINARMMGARGDGVTNDQPAIDAAVAAMTPGSVLYFPPGSYR